MCFEWSGMRSYPVQFEILDSTNELFAKFTAFDEDSFEVDIKTQILSPDNLRKIADELEKALELLKSGV